MNTEKKIPLSELLRPKKIEDVIGQAHLLERGQSLRVAIESGNLPSMILWGPPGVGKTTLAQIIAQQLKRDIYTLSAINSGVKDVREVIEKERSTLLFVDEIHRFNKSQQDGFLPFIENGTIVLIGATTENPSFF